MEANPSSSRTREGFPLFVRPAESMNPAPGRGGQAKGPYHYPAPGAVRFTQTMSPARPEPEASPPAQRALPALLHEIINPVLAVKTALRVLQSKKGDLAPDLFDRLLGSSIEELGKIEDLLRNLKAYSCSSQLCLQDVSLASLLDHLTTLVREAFSHDGVTLSIALCSSVLACRADPRALHQVLLNVLNNAFDACRGSPAPQISVSVSRREDRRILIRVRDNGCGMSAEQQARLFQPFQTTKPHGTGLGLCIGRELIQRMNGTIEVKSAPHAGSAVDITLPEASVERA